MLLGVVAGVPRTRRSGSAPPPGACRAIPRSPATSPPRGPVRTARCWSPRGARPDDLVAEVRGAEDELAATWQPLAAGVRRGRARLPATAGGPQVDSVSAVAREQHGGRGSAVARLARLGFTEPARASAARSRAARWARCRTTSGCSPPSGSTADPDAALRGLALLLERGARPRPAGRLELDDEVLPAAAARRSSGPAARSPTTWCAIPEHWRAAACRRARSGRPRPGCAAPMLVQVGADPDDPVPVITGPTPTATDMLRVAYREPAPRARRARPGRRCRRVRRRGRAGRPGRGHPRGRPGHRARRARQRRQRRAGWP